MVDCPSPADVAEAIGRRMPAAAIGGDHGWLIRYGWEGSPPTRAVTFRLMAPDGTPALQRQFPLRTHDCLAAAATIAVIVERYFRDLGWTTGASLPPVKVAGNAPAAVVAPGEDVLRLSLGGAVRVAGSASAAAIVGGRVHLLGPVHLGASLLLPSAASSQPLAQGGQVRADDWQARAFTWAVFPGSRVEWGAGLDALAIFQTASSSGIAHPAHKSRPLLALGIGAGPCYHWTPRWRIAVELAVYRALPATTFYVTERGVDGDVLPPPGWRYFGALSVGYVFGD